MMRSWSMVVALAALVSLSACNKLQEAVNSAQSGGSDAIAAAQQRTEDTGKTDPLLENPQVGDLYAGKISAISAITFRDERSGSTSTTEDVFGLLKGSRSKGRLGCGDYRKLGLAECTWCT